MTSQLLVTVNIGSWDDCGCLVRLYVWQLSCECEGGCEYGWGLQQGSCCVNMLPQPSLTEVPLLIFWLGLHTGSSMIQSWFTGICCYACVSVNPAAPPCPRLNHRILILSVRIPTLALAFTLRIPKYLYYYHL